MTVKCDWFVGCSNDAVGTLEHSILGPVAICTSCTVVIGRQEALKQISPFYVPVSERKDMQRTRTQVVTQGIDSERRSGPSMPAIMAAQFESLAKALEAEADRCDAAAEVTGIKKEAQVTLIALAVAKVDAARRIRALIK